MAEEIKIEENAVSEMSDEETLVKETTAPEMPAKEATPEAQGNSESHEPRKIENLEKALRVFKRKSAGIISEVRKREAYDSPSVKRKKKSKEARRKKRMGNKFGNRY